MSTRLYQTVGDIIFSDGWPRTLSNTFGANGILLDGAAADDTGGREFGRYDATTRDAGSGIQYTDDGVIPANSIITNVTARARHRKTNPDVAAFRPYTRLGGIAVTAASITCANAWVNTDTVWTQDPSGNAWTVASVFTATFGIVFSYDFSAIGDLGWWSWAYIGITFTLPVPTAVTDPATSLLETTTTLNGTINPNSANATYPCSYYFEYGLTTAYGAVTGAIGAQTGVADIAVTGAAVGLSPGTTYHFRLVCTNADQTVYGDDRTFVTAESDRFWLHEGHPTDGTLNPQALVRWDTIGFDIASVVLDCPLLTRDEDD